MKTSSESPESPEQNPASELAKRLYSAGAVLNREQAWTALVRAIPWLAGAVLVAFGLDVVFHFPGQVRAGLDGGLAASILVLCAIALQRGWLRRSDPQRTARVLETRDTALGSKLINILQLQSQGRDPSLQELTREMASAAVEINSAQLQETDLVALARTRAILREVKWVSRLLACMALVLIGFFGVTRTEWPRFWDPFGDHPPYSFTHLEINDPAVDGFEVGYGQAIIINANASGHRPGEVLLSFYPEGRPEAETTLPMFDKGPKGFSQQIQPVTSAMVVYAHTKNRHSLSKQRRIGMVLTPKLTTANVSVSPPKYTGLKPQTRPLEFKTLKALEGSELRFVLESNRPLTKGNLEIISAPDRIKVVEMQPVNVALNSGAAPDHPGDTAGSTPETRVQSRIVASESARLRFSLEDTEGRRSVETWEVALSVTHDLPPEVEITNPRSDCFVAMDFELQALFEARDDYGVKTLRLHQAINGQWAVPVVYSYPEGTPHASESLKLDFSEMSLKSGDTVSFLAEAFDTAPDPHMARSKMVTLTVITPAEYNTYLRQQTDIADVQAKYTQLINELRELAKNQEQLSKESEQLREALEKAKEPGSQAALSQKLDALLEKQKELNAAINKQAASMETFVRKDPLYDIEAELQGTLQKEAAKIQASAKENEAASKEVAQKSTPPEGGRKLDGPMIAQFKEAADKQAEALGGSGKELQKEVEEPLADMSLVQEILKDLNRFKVLFDVQSELVGNAAPYNKPGILSREDQLGLKDLAATEKALGEELEFLEQKLWDDGKAAAEKFPKAAQSAKDLAEQIGDQRLKQHADYSTAAMLGGEGEKSAQLAERLRAEMEKLFAKACDNPGQCQANSSELDQYLSLQQSPKKAGNSFKQMMECKKFGNGSKPGGKGRGQGGEGEGGYAITDGPSANVLGNETAISQSSMKAGSNGRSQTPQARPNMELSRTSGDKGRSVNPVNRESDAIQGEAPIDQYQDLVEKYFKAIEK